MLKIEELKKAKKICFNKIASSAIWKNNVTINIKPLGIELIEITISNGNDYARIITDNLSKRLVPEVCLSWNDFNKICELFSYKIKIDKQKDKIHVSEGETVLKFNAFKGVYAITNGFKFDFDNAILLNTKDLFVIQEKFQKYAILEDKLVSCDGNICIINKLNSNFGTELIQYVEEFPKENWYINKESNLIVSEDKRISLTHRQSSSEYPLGVFQLAKQHLSNSFECNAKTLYEKIQQCSLIYEIMRIKFEESQIVIESTGTHKFEAVYKTTLPVVYDHKTDREGFQFSIKYLADFCKCAGKDGKIKILFDDNPSVHMFRSENDKYIIFGMGIAKGKR